MSINCRSQLARNCCLARKLFVSGYKFDLWLMVQLALIFLDHLDQVDRIHYYPDCKEGLSNQPKVYALTHMQLV